MQRSELKPSFIVGAILLASTAGLSLAQTAKPLPYLDPSLPKAERAADLVGRMTLDEKISEMMNSSAAVQRLDVPEYNWWNEGLHGVARSGYATMFPQAIGMAATWDAPLVRQMGDVISTEARAKNNEALRHGNHSIYFGLTFWSPNINIFRDPRWGRGQETYGEDPFLTAQMGVNFVEGMQGTNPNYFKVIATPKHFAVHSGPESERHKFNVDPSPHDLWDTYMPAFRATIVDARADSTMCAYNALYGQPACGSDLLLKTILRGYWNFQGYVTSDCDAVADFYEKGTHESEPDRAHAAADALLHGTDTDCGRTYEGLADAVKEHLITEADIDASLRRLFVARMKLGLFDAPSMVPYSSIPFSEVNSPAHQALALEAAEKAMVLLKNDGILPLRTARYKTIAVIGPNAASLDSLEGNYNAIPRNLQLPVDALRTEFAGAHVVYVQGSPYVDGIVVPVPRTMFRPAAGSNEEGLKAEYFSNTGMTGTPVISRVDPQIDFDWSGVSPLPGNSATGFSIRWTGVLVPPAPGKYDFSVRMDRCHSCVGDRFSIVVDGKQVAGAVNEPPPAHGSGTTGMAERHMGPPHFTLEFADIRPHTIQIEMARSRANRGGGISLDWNPPAGLLQKQAAELASKSDLVIAMVGLSPRLEGEEMPLHMEGFSGGDRTDIALPAAQKDLLQQLAATGKPLVVVLLNGSALAVNWTEQHANAILEAWYPGEAGGKAIAETLVGRNNPAGRLPITFYSSLDELPPFTDYSMKDRTYRYFTGKTVYDFGYGLSYTKFAYSHLRLSTTKLNAGETLTVEADVRNTGARAGDEVAEMYLTPPHEGNGGLSPNVQLEGFQRVHLAPGQVRHVTFKLSPRDLSEVDAQGVRSVQPGNYEVSVGGSQPKDPRAPEAAQTASFGIVGSQELPH
ncbi:MAG TPA: glycoside hydrolase family 3 C-terminal domain-containing protein [Acidobacteriaceae bacterium]|jgi:beta-glucosidase|nr:glycoside hydrolase family 3 C-terminal domain-containing protein [Acidobacteriaceae bacterium]